MRFAYADPPYIGQANKHYGNEDSYGGEVDHQALLARLIMKFPDGWALSLSSPTLRQILSYLPDGYEHRIGAWVKPFASFKKGVNPAYAWEPVIFHGGRRGKDRDGGYRAPTRRDWVSANITMKKGLSGVKPEAFCVWLFELLGFEDGDELVDLYPGSGAVTDALGLWLAA